MIACGFRPIRSSSRRVRATSSRIIGGTSPAACWNWPMRTARSVAVIPSSSRNSRPVNSRKTSSRLGRLSETLASPMPARVQASTIAGTSASPFGPLIRKVSSWAATAATPGTARRSSSVRGSGRAGRIVTTSPPNRSFSSEGVPVATMWPWSMMARRSHRLSASSR